MRRESIEVTYTLRWNGVDLVVEVEGDPKHRNYDLFLVVEEQVAGNQWPHTSFLLPMTGQLTYVPESFFRAEQESIEKANSFWRDLLDHYAESEEVSPLDPVAEINWRDLYTVEGLARVAAIVQAERPDVLAAFMRRRLRLPVAAS